MRIRHKRTISFLIMLAMVLGNLFIPQGLNIFGNGPLTAYADTALSNVTLELSTVTVYPGDTVTASVYGNPNEDYGLGIFLPDTSDIYETPSDRWIDIPVTTDLEGKVDHEISIPEDMAPGEYDLGIYDTNDPQTPRFQTVRFTVEAKPLENLRERVASAIEGASNVVVTNHYSMDWAAIGLARAGKGQLIPADYLKEIEANLKNPDNNNTYYNKPTEFQRMTLGILAAGGDPTNIAGYNLIKQIYTADLESQGLNAIVFGLLAYDSGEYQIPADARWTREKLINRLVDAQCTEGGGWNLSGDGLGNADPDMTGMAMTALAPYNNSDYPAVQAAISKAADRLSEIQEPGGGYNSWGTINSESCAQVIMGLASNGIDPTGERFSKDGKNVVDALLTFEVPGGGFAHAEFRGNLTLNGMATEQALYALDQYIYFLEGKGSIYHWGKQAPIENGQAIVRIEGKDQVILTDAVVPLKKGKHTVKDVVKEALDAKGISYTENARGFSMINQEMADPAKEEAWLSSVENGRTIRDLSSRYVSNGESIIIYLGKDTGDFYYTWLGIPFSSRGTNPSIFTPQEITIYSGADLTLTAQGYSLGEEDEINTVANAAVYVNGKSDQGLLTDESGEVTVNFSQAGSYEVTIKGDNIRSAHFLIKTVADTEPPTANITNQVKDVITTDVIPVFYITPADNKDEAVDITMVVKLNGKVLTAKSVNTRGRHEFRDTSFDKHINILEVIVTDTAGNTATIRREVTNSNKPVDPEPEPEPEPEIIDIPVNEDFKYKIPVDDSNKVFLLQIPENNSARVMVELPHNSSLPEIKAEKGIISAMIPKGAIVTSGDSSAIELMTTKDTGDTAIKAKVNTVVPAGRKLDKIHSVSTMGGNGRVEFSDYVTIDFAGMKGMEAAYIENGKLYPIQKYASDSEGKNGGKTDYFYYNGNNLIIKTKHFTDFVIYSTSTEGTPGGGTDPDTKEYVTLSVDKKTINKGYVISSRKVELEEGDNAWTVLKRVLDDEGIDCDYKYYKEFDSIYVQSIDGDGEFDHGSGSGWMYNVNGWYPNYGASKYELEDGDRLEWRYTTNLGKDLGEDLSEWDPDDKDDSSKGHVVNSEDGKSVVEVPKDIDKDFIIRISKNIAKDQDITINVPKVQSKVVLDVNEVKSNIPKTIINKENLSFVIEKGTKLKFGSSQIELFTEIGSEDEKIQMLVEAGLGNSINKNSIDIFFMGHRQYPQIFDKPVTFIIEGGKERLAGFIEEDGYKAIQLYKTEEAGAQATQDQELKVYGYLKGEDLIVKTNYLTTLVLYSIEKEPQGSQKGLEKYYKDANTISSWAYEAIDEATQKGLIQGNNGQFSPKADITRAEFAKLMVSALGLEVNVDKAIDFSDVGVNDWFYSYINAAYGAGIVSGDGNRFYPHQNITREEMAVILVRALNMEAAKPDTAIKDMNRVSSWAKDAVETIVAQGLMVGHNDEFNPKDFATREMATVVAMRAHSFQGAEKPAAVEEIQAIKEEKPENNEVKQYIEETGALMQRTITNPVVASVGGEWTVLSLARSHVEVPEGYFVKYYTNVEKKLKETDGKLHRIKYTEYDRVILALTSIDKGVTDVAGYDLTKPLADFNTLIKQGLNGPIWALIALDSKGYEIPIDPEVEVQTTRQMLIDYILAKEIPGGGWSLTSEAPADTDITAMALQALSKYQDQEKVRAATGRALHFLSTTQQDDGSFMSSWGDEESSESIAQVIVALTSLNIDPKKDKRFIKNGRDAITALLEFYVEGGGFKHILSGELDPMATDQGMYALIAYDRFINGKNQLYDMGSERD
ncbi:S-layer homology domain-containing protein [Alkaliphilus crotonatoxidans]